MKLISLNIENNLHNHTVLPFLKKENPDIVCLQELMEEDLELYKKELSMEAVFQPWSYIRTTIYKEELRGKKQGVAIFAKNIYLSGSAFYTGSEENIKRTYEDFMSTEEYQKNKALVWADIENKDGGVFRIITTQLPVTHEGEVTFYQLEVIEALLKKLESYGEFVLCGDTNAPRGQESFKKFTKKYKDNIPEEYKTSIDQNLHRTKNLEYMVDGLFTTQAYSASSVHLVDGVSDHMAVVADIEKIK